MHVKLFNNCLGTQISGRVMRIITSVVPEDGSLVWGVNPQSGNIHINISLGSVVDSEEKAKEYTSNLLYMLEHRGEFSTREQKFDDPSLLGCVVYSLPSDESDGDEDGEDTSNNIYILSVLLNTKPVPII